MRFTRPRLAATGRTALAVAAAMGLTLTAATPAHASPARAVNPCLVHHDLYQQPVATVIAIVEAPEAEGCHVGTISLDVYRNDVLIGDISGSSTLVFRYDCVTTEPTRWHTNWNPSIVLNCG